MAQGIHRDFLTEADPGLFDRPAASARVDSDATYYNRRRTYGHLEVDQAKRLKKLQKENVRLKKLVAVLSLDKAILKEAIEGQH